MDPLFCCGGAEELTPSAAADWHNINGAKTAASNKETMRFMGYANSSL